MNELSAIGTRIEQRADAVVNSSERLFLDGGGREKWPPYCRVVIGSVVGDSGEQPVAPRRRDDAGVGHGSEAGEKLDDGWAERFGLVRADLL